MGGGVDNSLLLSCSLLAEILCSVDKVCKCLIALDIPLKRTKVMHFLCFTQRALC